MNDFPEMEDIRYRDAHPDHGFRGHGHNVRARIDSKEHCLCVRNSEL